MPVDDYFLGVFDGKIMQDSIIFDDDSLKEKYSNIDTYSEKLGLNFNWIGMNKFHAYSFAEKEYFQTVK